jgi:hypothetical protein
MERYLVLPEEAMAIGVIVVLRLVVFMRGTCLFKVQLVWGAEFHVMKKISGDFLDITKEISANAGVARGIYGAYVEVGISGTGTCSYVSTTNKKCDND